MGGPGSGRKKGSAGVKYTPKKLISLKQAKKLGEIAVAAHKGSGGNYKGVGAVVQSVSDSMKVGNKRRGGFPGSFLKKK